MTYSLDGHGPAVLQLTPQHDPGGTTITARGELDIATAEHLPAFVRALSDEQCAHLLLDLADLDFIDAAGLTALVRTDDLVRGRGGLMTVRGARPLVRHMVRITGLPLTLDADADQHCG